MTDRTRVLSAPVAIAATEAAHHGLPAVGVSLDATGTGMIVSLFSEPGVFLRASSPPGGMLLFDVLACAEPLVNREALVRALLAQTRQRELQPGATFGSAMVAGARRDVAVVCGTNGIARIAWAGVHVATPLGGVLVVGSSSVAPTATISAACVITQSLLAPMFQTLAIEGAVAPAAIGADEPPLPPWMPPRQPPPPAQFPPGLEPLLGPAALPFGGGPPPHVTLPNAPFGGPPPIPPPSLPTAVPTAPPPVKGANAPSRYLTAAKMGAPIGITEPEFSPSDPRTVPPSTVNVMGWPDALAPAARLPRALGALLGLAVGDALGTTNEFKPMIAPTFPELATGPISDIVGGGPFGLQAGQVTDDTQMASAIADLFWKVNMFTSGTLAVRYLAWRGVAFDVGAQIGQALDLIQRGCPPERAGRLVWDERNRFPAGNGALMRTAVIGVMLAANPDARREAALLDSAITHFDPRSQLACAAFDAAIAHALTARPSPQSMLRAAREELAVAAALLRTRHPDILAEIDAAERVLGEDLDAARDDDPALYGDELHIQNSKGFVRVACRLAFWELLHAPDFRSAVVDAANRGGDADTNAAIVGALLGAYHGIEAIPPAWVERVLAAPGVGFEDWDFHPRVFLRALTKGFLGERDTHTIAALAPYLAIASPALAPAGPAVRPDGSVTLATAAYPLRPHLSLPLLRDLLAHADHTPGFEHVTADQVVLTGDNETLRVASIEPARPRTPDELARMPRTLLCAPPELVAGYGIAPAVTASYNACALWAFALRRHGQYDPSFERPMGRAIELPSSIAQPIANAVLTALNPDARARVPARFILTMIDLAGRL